MGKKWAKRIWTIFGLAEIGKKIDQTSVLRAETRRFELLKGLTPYLVSGEAHSTKLYDYP